MVIGFVGIVAIIFLGELWIKNRVEQSKPPGEKKERVICNGAMILRRYHNHGAFLNLGEKRKKLIAVLSVFFSVGITILFICSLGTRGNHQLRTGLALLLGGAFSNTYDRLKRKYVVDYVSFGVKWKRLQNIVFNISDFCIIIGALLTVLST